MGFGLSDGERTPLKIIVSLEQRFDRTSDGSVWGPGAYSHSFWLRYLDVFDQVRVVARIRDVHEVPGDYRQANGTSVEFVGVPYYLGPWGYLRSWRQIVRVVENILCQDYAVIMRVPSPIAGCMHGVLRRKRQPYGLEVIGDPYDVFSPGAVMHPLRPFFRWLLPRQMRQQCGAAAGAAYVTQRAIQERYPCGGYSVGLSDVELPVQAFITAYSSIELGHGDFVESPRAPASAQRKNLIFVGTLEQIYKGQDVLIEAVSRLVREGLDLGLTWVGDGKCRQRLETRSAELGVGPRVVFHGRLPSGDAIRAELDKADLFVLPSRTEGLPRAMIEAMARGIPCIGSNVGGIPELLPPEDLVPPGDSNSLARKIREVLSDPSRMAHMSARNLKVAQGFRAEVLREMRIPYYRFLRKQTEAWMRVKKTQ